jgi:aminopeptidase N
MLPGIPKRLLVFSSVVVLFGALAVFTLAERGLAQTAQPPKAFPPTRYVPSHDFDTRHIALNLHFDWEQEQAIGTETITLTPLVKGFDKVELDAADMAFSSVKLELGAALKYEFDASRQKLWITLDRAYQPNDEIALTISYHTNGKARLTGLVGGGLKFIKPTPEDATRPKQIWSQGESEYNHIGSLLRSPNDFSLRNIVTVEKPLTVVSKASCWQPQIMAGHADFSLEDGQPHAGYLTSIVVGEYTPIVQDYAGIPVITYVYPNEVAEGNAARLAEMVRFFLRRPG